MGLGFGPLELSRLALLYDLSRAESRVAEEVLEDLGSIHDIDPKALELIERTYRHYMYAGKEAVEDLRSNLPEVSRTIETRLARRIALNFEREEIHRMAATGALDERAVESLLADVEHRMKLVGRGRARVELLDFRELCAATPLLAHLDKEAVAAIERLSTEQVLAPDEVLFQQGDKGDSMYIVARGAAYVLRQPENGGPSLHGVLGSGDIVGEMALLTGEARSATIRAATTLTLFRIEREAFRKLTATYPSLEEQIWHAFAEHVFDNLVKKMPDYSRMDREARMAWFRRGEELSLRRGDAVPSDGADLVFLLSGELRAPTGRYASPALVPVKNLSASGSARIVLLPAP